MSTNKVARAIGALIILGGLAILVWQLAPDEFFYASIAAVAVVALLAIFFIYRTLGRPAVNVSEPANQSASTHARLPDQAPVAGESDTALDNRDAVQLFNQRGKVPEGNLGKPKASDVAARYYKMAAEARVTETNVIWQAPRQGEEPAAEEGKEAPTPEVKAVQEAPEQPAGVEPPADADAAARPMPIINEATSLTQDEKNTLVNAVWYRCENPYCKYTHFLDVHHIVEEKDGGTNRLDNLIVLCPYCHDLAHKSEIPAAEMRVWVANREERFKLKLDWRY